MRKTAVRIGWRFWYGEIAQKPTVETVVLLQKVKSGKRSKKVAKTSWQIRAEVIKYASRLTSDGITHKPLKRTLKKFQKNWKKCLTNGKDGDIIDKLSRKRRERRIGHWKLNNKRWSTKHMQMCERRISQFLENTTQTKVKRADYSSKKGFKPRGLRYNFLESLILAQD